MSYNSKIIIQHTSNNYSKKEEKGKRSFGNGGKMKNGVVKFYGQELITARDDEGTEYVAMKPLVENMGLDWRAQYKRILRDDVLNTCVVMMDTQLPNDIQRRQVVFMPIEYLNGWLFGIDTSRVENEAVREKIIVYKKECYKVLHNYWSNSGSDIESRLNKLENMVEMMSEGFKELSSAMREFSNVVAKQPNTTNIMLTQSPFVTINPSLKDDTKKKKSFRQAVIGVLMNYPDGIAQTDLIYRSGFGQSETTRRWLHEEVGNLWDMYIVPGKGYRYILKDELVEINS